MKLLNATASLLLNLSIFAIPVPAEAAPSTCWLNFNGSSNVDPQTCDVTLTTNSRGLRVLNVTTFGDGATGRIILWKESDGTPLYAEMTTPSDGGGTVRTLWYYKFDNEGDLHFTSQKNPAIEFWVRIPGNTFNRNRRAGVLT